MKFIQNLCIFWWIGTVVLIAIFVFGIVAVPQWIVDNQILSVLGTFGVDILLTAIATSNE